MIELVLDECSEKMKKSIESFTVEMKKLRSGRAHPNLLDHIRVDHYGQETPLKQMSNISVEDARTLAVTPWEKTMVQAIEKAIKISNLGVNPVVNGGTIRVPLPPLTAERRQELVKVAKSEAENNRVSIRNTRRQAMSDVKKMLQDKEITEDDERQAGVKIQALTDQFIKELDEHLSAKEQDLTSV